jgi:hypothetical protein
MPEALRERALATLDAMASRCMAVVAKARWTQRGNSAN